MTIPNQRNIRTDVQSLNAMMGGTRYESFSDAELALLNEGLRDLLQTKREALEIANADLGSNPKHPFTEWDFGIPEIERMLVELEQEL